MTAMKLGLGVVATLLLDNPVSAPINLRLLVPRREPVCKRASLPRLVA